MYEAQATKGTVSDFRIMKLSSAIILGEAALCTEKDRSHGQDFPARLMIQGSGQQGPVTAAVSPSSAVLAETGPLSAQTFFFLPPPYLPSISSVVCKLIQMLCSGLFIHNPKVENA